MSPRTGSAVTGRRSAGRRLAATLMVTAAACAFLASCAGGTVGVSYGRSGWYNSVGYSPWRRYRSHRPVYVVTPEDVDDAEQLPIDPPGSGRWDDYPREPAFGGGDYYDDGGGFGGDFGGGDFGGDFGGDW